MTCLHIHLTRFFTVLEEISLRNKLSQLSIIDYTYTYGHFGNDVLNYHKILHPTFSAQHYVSLHDLFHLASKNPRFFFTASKTCRSSGLAPPCYY